MSNAILLHFVRKEHSFRLAWHMFRQCRVNDPKKWKSIKWLLNHRRNDTIRAPVMMKTEKKKPESSNCCLLTHFCAYNLNDFQSNYRLIRISFSLEIRFECRNFIFVSTGLSRSRIDAKLKVKLFLFSVIFVIHFSIYYHLVFDCFHIYDLKQPVVELTVSFFIIF